MVWAITLEAHKTAKGPSKFHLGPPVISGNQYPHLHENPLCNSSQITKQLRRKSIRREIHENKRDNSFPLPEVNAIEEALFPISTSHTCDS